MTYRRAKVDDADALLAFWAGAGASMRSTGNADWWRRSPTVCGRTAIVYQGAAMLVATEDGRIVGSLLGTFDGWRGNLYRSS